MVGIAGYKCIICKKRPKLNGHMPTMCNKLIELPFCCSLFRLRYGYLRAGCRVSRPKSALWKPFFHIANRLFNINAVQLTMLCKQAAVSHGLSRPSAAALPAGHTCPPQPHIFACPRCPAPRAPLAPSARAACIAPSCTAPPCTALRAPHTIPHRAQKPRERSLPGRGAMGRQCRLTRR